MPRRVTRRASRDSDAHLGGEGSDGAPRDEEKENQGDSGKGSAGQGDDTSEVDEQTAESQRGPSESLNSLL